MSLSRVILEAPDVWWCRLGKMMMMKEPFIFSPCLSDSLSEIISKKEGQLMSSQPCLNWFQSDPVESHQVAKEILLLPTPAQQWSSSLCSTLPTVAGQLWPRFWEISPACKCVTGLYWQPVVQQRIGNENHHYRHKVPFTRVSIT